MRRVQQGFGRDASDVQTGASQTATGFNASHLLKKTRAEIVVCYGSEE